MSLFPSILWQKVLQWTSSDPQRQSDSTIQHLNEKFHQINQEEGQHGAEQNYATVAPHLHPMVFPPFGDVSHLSHHQHELRLRNSRHERDLSMLLDELNMKVQRKYRGDFQEYVRREILGKVQNGTKQLSLDEILKHEMKQMLERGSKREHRRREWLKYDFSEHFGAEWDRRWQGKRDLIKSVERTHMDGVLDHQEVPKGKVGGASGPRNLLKEDVQSTWGGGIDDSMLPPRGIPRQQSPHDSIREDASLRYSQSSSSGGIPFSQQYRLSRAHLFEKKVSQIFRDPLTSQKDGTNIFEDPFGLGLEASLEAYHPHHFMSLVREEDKSDRNGEQKRNGTIAPGIT